MVAAISFLMVSNTAAINGFISGTGSTRWKAGNLSSGNYFSRLTGLVQNTIYYYKAYAINNGGIAYGSQRSFITGYPGGLVILFCAHLQGGTMHIIH